MRYPDRTGETSIHIHDEATTHKFVAAHIERDPAAPAAQIPIGVLVRTVRFVDANDLVVSGTVWQRIPVSGRCCSRRASPSHLCFCTDRVPPVLSVDHISVRWVESA
jgi:hypothetical protein